MTQYKLFLDDLRGISDIYPQQKAEDWIIARNFNQAVAHLYLHGCPAFISFDNDLGEGEKEGYDFAKELVEMDMDGLIVIHQDFAFNVHSANCKAWANITTYLDNYLNHKYGKDRYACKGC